jgi:hypothetical protein
LEDVKQLTPPIVYVPILAALAAIIMLQNGVSIEVEKLDENRHEVERA